MNNDNNGICDEVAIEVYNAAKVKVPLLLLFLLAGITYMGDPLATRASSLPVTTIVGGQTSNL